MSATCSGCGREIEGGTAGCRAEFDTLLARDFSDARFFSVHRLFVDTYSLQHPDEFCRSAKSLAAHLVGLMQIVEAGASPASGDAALRDWLDGSRALDKPPVPAERGAITLADVSQIDDPAAWREALRRWAESTWAAWAELHPLARLWAQRIIPAKAGTHEHKCLKRKPGVPLRRMAQRSWVPAFAGMTREIGLQSGDIVLYLFPRCQGRYALHNTLPFDRFAPAGFAPRPVFGRG